MVRGGSGTPSSAAGGPAAAEAAICDPGEGPAADVRRVRHAGGALAGGVSAVSGERLARNVRSAGSSDPVAVAGNDEPVCGGMMAVGRMSIGEVNPGDPSPRPPSPLPQGKGE